MGYWFVPISRLGFPRCHVIEGRRRREWTFDYCRDTGRPEFGDPFTLVVMLIGDQGKHARACR
jgi:hypothetical protein